MLLLLKKLRSLLLRLLQMCLELLLLLQGPKLR
jgi:hypothetical protein